MRAALGLLEATPPPGDGAGEGALFVAEELTLEQGVGHGGAIDLNHRPLMTAAVFVNRTSHQFLAGAGFAMDENGGVGVSHLIDQAQDFLDDFGAADDTGLGTFGFGQHAAQTAVFFLDYPEVYDLAEQFRNGAENLHLPVQVVHLMGQLVGREHPHGPFLVEDGNAKKGQFVSIQRLTGPGAIQEECFIAEIGNGQRAPGLGHLARNAFARLITDLSGLDIHPPGDIQQRPCRSAGRGWRSSPVPCPARC